MMIAFNMFILILLVINIGIIFGDDQYSDKNDIASNLPKCLNQSYPAGCYPLGIDDKKSNIFEPAINRNSPLECQNPSSNFPRGRDSGLVKTFKYSFGVALSPITPGGWFRQVTKDDLPVAKHVSGAQMRLIKGGVSEMHWHPQAELGYVLFGECRITLVNQLAEGFVDNVKANDLWYFPPGLPHSIQGVGDYGCFFVTAYDSGSFSTFLLTNVMRSTPSEVLAKNFQVDNSTFDHLPPQPLIVFAAKSPQPLDKDKDYVNWTPSTYAFFADHWENNVTREGGTIKVIDASNFPVTTICAAIVTLYPGAMREIIWHEEADTWLYFIAGAGRMTVHEPNGNSRTMDFQAGDVGYVQKSYPHYVENTGCTNLQYLAVIPTQYFKTVTLATFLANTPPRMVNENIRTPKDFPKSIEKTPAGIQP